MQIRERLLELSERTVFWHITIVLLRSSGRTLPAHVSHTYPIPQALRRFSTLSLPRVVPLVCARAGTTLQNENGFGGDATPGQQDPCPSTKVPQAFHPKADTGPVSLSPTPGVSHPTMSLMAAEQLFEIQNCVYLRAEMEVHVHSFRCALSRVTYPFRPASAISSAPSPATTANPPSGACSLWRALASLVQEPPHLSPHPGGQRYPRPRQTRRERNSSIRQNVALSFGVALLKTELWRRLPIRIRLGVKST